MDIGKIKNNKKYYDGYESEPEFIITIEKNTAFKLHIWEGYIEDICGSKEEEDLKGEQWLGFTRDYQLLYGIFSGDDFYEMVFPKEYLEDLKTYPFNKFSYEETKEVFELLLEFLEKAVALSSKVTIEIK